MKKWLLAISLAFSQLSYSAAIPEFPFILVSGNAKVKVKPDRVKVSFRITEFNKDADKATAQVSQRGRSIVELADKLGIPASQVTSSSYNKSTTRKRDDNYNNLDILGYEIRQDFQVQIENINVYSSFADKLLTFSHVEDISSDFYVSNREEVETNLVKAAIKDAKQKAAVLMDGMGLKVGAVYAVTQDSNLGAFQAVFGAPEYASVANAPPDFVPPPSLDFVRDGPNANMFVPKTIEFSKNVSVVYKIKQ